jgi:DNA-binding NarL/FixJ family response regulator
MTGTIKTLRADKELAVRRVMGDYETNLMSTGRPRVLLADDFPDLLRAIARLLAPDCEVVGSVDDGGALLEAAERLQPDLIVLDLNMPTVSGLEACRRIRQANPRIKVILLTAGGDPAIMGAALAAGASAFIEKQAIADDLLPAIKSACAEDRRDVV